MFKRLATLLLLLSLAACSKSASSPLPTMTPGGTTAIPATLPSLPQASPTPAGSPTPFTSFDVKPAVDGLKLRIGPGYLFDALRLLEAEAVLSVQGKAPGGEWIKVRASDGTQGWVFAQMVTSSIDLQAIPVIEPQGIVIIKGRVSDVLGSPISGVGFEAIPQGGGSADGNVAFSDSSGAFYLFLPIEASGAWTITKTALDCKSNAWADSSCATYKASYTGNVEPPSQNVSLPQTGEATFTFK